MHALLCLMYEAMHIVSFGIYMYIVFIKKTISIPTSGGKGIALQFKDFLTTMNLSCIIVLSPIRVVEKLFYIHSMFPWNQSEAHLRQQCMIIFTLIFFIVMVSACRVRVRVWIEV